MTSFDTINSPQASYVLIGQLFDIPHMLLPLAVYGGGEKVVNIPTPHTVELPPCVMTCDLVHYYLNEPVGDKHGEEFLVSTDRTLSHLTSGLLTPHLS